MQVLGGGGVVCPQRCLWVLQVPFFRLGWVSVSHLVHRYLHPLMFQSDAPETGRMFGQPSGKVLSSIAQWAGLALRACRVSSKMFLLGFIAFPYRVSRHSSAWKRGTHTGLLLARAVDLCNTSNGPPSGQKSPHHPYWV